MPFATLETRFLSMRIKITRTESIKPDQMGIPEFARLAKVSPSTAYRWRMQKHLDSIDAGDGTVDRAAAPGWIKLNVKAKKVAK